MTVCHLAEILPRKNGDIDKEKLSEIKRTMESSLGKLMKWARDLPKEFETIRAARTPMGRIVKTLLFWLSMPVPLGILVVALLFWHGSRISGRSLHPVAA